MHFICLFKALLSLKIITLSYGQSVSDWSELFWFIYSHHLHINMLKRIHLFSVKIYHIINCNILYISVLTSWVYFVVSAKINKLCCFVAFKCKVPLPPPHSPLPFPHPTPHILKSDNPIKRSSGNCELNVLISVSWSNKRGYRKEKTSENKIENGNWGKWVSNARDKECNGDKDTKKANWSKG